MSIILEDRKAEYLTEYASWTKLNQMTPEEIIEAHEAEIELKMIKLQQKKQRLEALGVNLEDGS